jgi:O-antigen/teichoic acid export membrane protein
MASKATNVLSGLITVPITLPYLGFEQFGIWMALTGFVAFLSLSDFGLSIGMQTKLTACMGKDDRETPSALISTTLIPISAIVLVLCVFATLIVPSLDITKIIAITEKNNVAILLLSTQVTIITFAIGLFSGVIQRIFEGYQDGFTSNIFLAVGRILSLISVFICVDLALPLPYMIGLYMGLPFLTMTIAGGWLFYSRKWLRPSISKVDFQQLRSITKIGGLAFSAQVGATIMSSGPLLVLSSRYGAEAIIPFAITQRLLSVTSLFLSAILAPLWPAFGEAKARGDWHWVVSTFKKSIYLSIAVACVSFFIAAIFGQDIISFWSGSKDAVPSWYLLIVCSIWMIIFALIRATSMLLNGTGSFKGQAIYGTFFPTVAVFWGWSLPTAWSLTACLAIMIFIGEGSRLIFMSLESRRILNKSAVFSDAL